LKLKSRASARAVVMIAAMARFGMGSESESLEMDVASRDVTDTEARRERVVGRGSHRLRVWHACLRQA
jgi:hypothetical protein